MSDRGECLRFLMVRAIHKNHGSDEMHVQDWVSPAGGLSPTTETINCHNGYRNAGKKIFVCGAAHILVDDGDDEALEIIKQPNGASILLKAERAAMGKHCLMQDEFDEEFTIAEFFERVTGSFGSTGV